MIELPEGLVIISDEALLHCGESPEKPWEGR